MRKISSHILVALAYLHDCCGIIHTDLKPENILVTAPTLPPPRPTYTSRHSRTWRSPPVVAEQTLSISTPATICVDKVGDAKQCDNHTAESAANGLGRWSNLPQQQDSVPNGQVQLSDTQKLTSSAASRAQAAVDQPKHIKQTDNTTRALVGKLRAALHSLQETLEHSSGKVIRKRLKKKIRAKLKQLEALNAKPTDTEDSSSDKAVVAPSLEAEKELPNVSQNALTRSRLAVDNIPPYVRHRLKPAGSDPLDISSYRNQASAAIVGELLYSRPMYHYATYWRLFPKEFSDDQGRETGLLPLTKYQRSLSRNLLNVAEPSVSSPSLHEHLSPSVPLASSFVNPSASTVASHGGRFSADQCYKVKMSKAELPPNDDNDQDSDLTSDVVGFASYPLTSVLTSQGLIELK